MNPIQLHRALAINMKHGNLEAWAGEMLAANNVIESVNHSLYTIHTPAIVIQGEHDKLVYPHCGRRLAATLPHAQLEMIGGGHMAPYTPPRHNRRSRASRVEAKHPISASPHPKSMTLS